MYAGIVGCRGCAGAAVRYLCRHCGSAGSLYRTALPDVASPAVGAGGGSHVWLRAHTARNPHCGGGCAEIRREAAAAGQPGASAGAGEYFTERKSAKGCAAAPHSADDRGRPGGGGAGYSCGMAGESAAGWQGSVSGTGVVDCRWGGAAVCGGARWGGCDAA